MDTARVRSRVDAILALPELERQQLAREVLPVLLRTRAGLEEIDEALRALSDESFAPSSSGRAGARAISRRARSPSSSRKDCARRVLTVVVDTQVILRGAASARTSVTGKPDDAWDTGRVTGRLRMRVVEAVALVELHRRRAVFVAPGVPIVLGRDPDDDTFLACAVAGGADYVVSAERDLLDLRVVHGLPIVDAPTFWQAPVG